MPDLLERRLRAAAHTLDALGQSAPEAIMDAWDDLVDHILPAGDLVEIDTLLSAIEAGLVPLVYRGPRRHRRAAERRKLHQARAGRVRLQRRCEIRHRQRIASARPRTRPRARRRRHGARRAGGVRSGQDPGDDDPHLDRHQQDRHGDGCSRVLGGRS